MKPTYCSRTANDSLISTRGETRWKTARTARKHAQDWTKKTGETTRVETWETGDFYCSISLVCEK